MVTLVTLVAAGHTRWVWDCVFSVDAAYLVTASSDATARLWDLSGGESMGLYQHSSQGGV
jgi:G protein beta subunit-like protein